MIQNVIRSLGSIASYGVLSLCLFGAVFAGVLVWAALQKKNHLERMARVPLETDAADESDPRNSHE